MNVAPDGSPIEGEGDRLQTDFTPSVFEAALDAKEGRPWARQSEPDQDAPERWWPTQGRHLALGARVVGIARDLSDRARGGIAAVLLVNHLQLREGSRAVGYRAVGQAICAVLTRMIGGARRALQLLVCGHLAGLWGEPLYWDVERQQLERSPFLIPGTDPANGAGSLNEPTTKSGPRRPSERGLPCPPS